jgi:hypothetical protein
MSEGISTGGMQSITSSRTPRRKRAEEGAASPALSTLLTALGAGGRLGSGQEMSRMMKQAARIAARGTALVAALAAPAFASAQYCALC